MFGTILGLFGDVLGFISSIIKEMQWRRKILKVIENFWNYRSRVIAIHFHLDLATNESIKFACELASEPRWKKDVTYLWLYRVLRKKHAIYCKYFRDQIPYDSMENDWMRRTTKDPYGIRRIPTVGAGRKTRHSENTKPRFRIYWSTAGDDRRSWHWIQDMQTFKVHAFDGSRRKALTTYQGKAPE